MEEEKEEKNPLPQSNFSVKNFFALEQKLKTD